MLLYIVFGKNHTQMVGWLLDSPHYTVRALSQSAAVELPGEVASIALCLAELGIKMIQNVTSLCLFLWLFLAEPVYTVYMYI
jgi:hypothetical protein